MSRVIFVAIILLLIASFSTEAQTTKFIEHKVRWMENIYTISRKYGIDPNAVLAYNHITANEIRRGIIIRIPVVYADEISSPPVDSLHQTAPLELSIDYYHECLEYRSSPETVHRASLILPFQLQESQPKNEFLEFYEGLLLAVEDLKSEGLSLHLSTYDVGNYPSMMALAQSGALLNQELVIGPVAAQDLFEVLNYTYGQNIKIVSPLDPQAESAAYVNPNFFQVNTSLYWQQANLIRYIPLNSGMVWLMYEDSDQDLELVNITKDILRENRIIYREFIHKISKDQDITGELSYLLTQGYMNRIIVASSDEAFVSDILRSLYLVHTRRNCPITLYGNAKWRNFESVDLDYYHSMNLHLSVPNYVDYQNPEVKRFLARFRALYQAEPSAYAYQGYDVGTYFLRALYTKGPSFEYCMEEGNIPASPLQSNFRFQKVGPDGGFINTDTRIIQYLPDYRVEILH